ncbi:uncharacterized mitochondrial protein AtMg00810-like [Lathyrus oleraceus]|uniref:uncharacterized mitochondrial protein AtMg00810-like n=1 Tax=Pisum sativum TaxID=3888 RepID=UPI0021D249D1|nr:uncharacterized mitochondrial protein AtMg00810-like [Pisum sativum]
MKVLGTLNYFLGIEVAYSLKGCIQSQSKYIANILEPAQLSNTREVNNSLELNVKYAPSDGVTLPDLTLYRTLVGSLVYLMTNKPDIAYVVSPATIHWEVVLRILHYIRGT